jgi:coatomer protein complex subunit alpha (xenin)
VVDSRKEVDEVKELLGIAKDYALALRIELKRKDPALKDDLLRQAELAAYFTHCNLQPTHLKLSLQSAMSICFKAKNYGTAATFARRLLELNLPPQVATKARQVWKFHTSGYIAFLRGSHVVSFLFLVDNLFSQGMQLMTL